MPVYEYKCCECGERFEIKRNLCAEERAVKCPRCGAKNAERVFSLFGTVGYRAPSCPTSGHFT